MLRHLCNVYGCTTLRPGPGARGEAVNAPKPKPLDVECPFCWAAIGEPCYAGLHRGNFCKPHAARVRLAEKETGK